MKNQKIWVLVLAFVVVLGGAYALYQNLGQKVGASQLAPQEQNGAEEPEAVLAPDFTVYDVDGNEVRLSDFTGSPVVLNFWASWCGPCRSEMGTFNEVSAELEGKVQFLMVNSTDGARETVEKASNFVQEKGYTFSVFYDTASEASIAYGAYSLPTTYFIDADGYVIAGAVGALDKETLQTGIDLLLVE